jgi:hypothetical protein
MKKTAAVAGAAVLAAAGLATSAPAYASAPTAQTQLGRTAPIPTFDSARTPKMRASVAV